MSYEEGATSSFFSQLQQSLNPDTPLVTDSATFASSTSDVALVNETPDISPALDLSNEESFPALKPSSKKPVVAPINGFTPRPVSKGGSIPVHRNVTERFEIPANLQVFTFNFYFELLIDVNDKAKQILGQKKTVGDVCKEIMKKTGTTIEFSTVQRTGTMFFLVTGKPEDVKGAKRLVMTETTKPVSTTYSFSIPASIRPRLVGAGGKNLKALIAKTMTRIDMPKNTGVNGTQQIDGEEEEIVVTITGDFEGVEIAKKEIELLVSQKAAKHIVHVPVDHSFYPFVQRDLSLPPLVKIDYFPFNSDPTKISEVILRGDRTEVLATQQQILSLVEQLTRSTTVVKIDVDKRQHKFVVGQQGSVIQEIFDKSGCSVDVPPASDLSISITIRGHSSNLPSAMSLILEKANSVQFVEINLASILPADTRSDLFMRYVNLKEKSSFKAIEAEYNAKVVYLTSQSTKAAMLEVQAKTLPEAEKAAVELKKAIANWSSTLYFSVIEIPRFLHRYAVGKGGQNITKAKSNPEWNGRFVDAIFAPENEESDDVVIVIKRSPKEDPNKFVEKVRDELIANASAMEDFVTETLKIEQKYHGRLIGAGGATVKEIKGQYGDSIQIKFPPSSQKGSEEKQSKKDANAPTEPNSIIIRGPKKEVAEIKAKIIQFVADWEHNDFVNNHNENLTLPKGIAKRLLSSQAQQEQQKEQDGQRTSNTSWLVRAVKEHIVEAKLKIDTSTLIPTSFRVDITEAIGNATFDSVSIFGPKDSVGIAKNIMIERGKKLADFLVVEINIFESVSPAAKKVLESENVTLVVGDERLDMKKKILRRVIGREGRLVKKLSEKHGVTVRFLDGRRNKKSEEENEETAPGEDGAVLIKGPKEDVNAAKQELLEFVEHEILNSHVLVFQIPSSTLPYVVGRGGSKVSKIKDDNEVRIDFVDVLDGSDKVEVVIEGVKNKCLLAKKAIDIIVDEKVNTESLAILVPSSLHKVIIGTGGTRIKKLIEQFGGQDKAKVQFPRAGVSGLAGDLITFRANVQILPLIRAEIEKLLVDALNEDVHGNHHNGTSSESKATKVPVFETQAEFSEDGIATIVEDINSYGYESTVELTTVPKSDVPRNNTVRELMKKYGVAVILIPHDHDDGENVVTIKIVAHKGDESLIDVVKNEIQSQVRVSSRVEIPESILASLKDSGSSHDAELSSLNEIARRLRSENGVYVDIVINEGFIDIRGEQKKLQKAVVAAKHELTELAKYDASAQFPVESHFRPHIIGRMGATITKIREQTGTQVEIIRGSNNRQVSSTDFVVIRGSAEGVKAAKALVEEIISRQEERQKNEQTIRATIPPIGTGVSSSGLLSPSLNSARIDDDSSETGSHLETESNSVRFIPGYSKGSSNVLRKTGSIAVNSTVVSVTANATAYMSTVKVEDTQWQNVKTRKPKKSGEEEPQTASIPLPAPPVPQADSQTPKKKKNKKIKQVTNSEATVQVEILAPVEPEVIISIPVVTPAPVIIPTVVKQIVKPVVVEAEILHINGNTPKQSELVYEVDVDSEVPDDGWQTVNTVKKFKQQKIAETSSPAPIGTANAASVLVDESASKKKKNKKKKNAGAASELDG
ncbi:hypothetical protein HK096_005406 [Nowakowskiella sp. JEL0078]|nr:hypothetical protein HK096_005406 [Nowakowskiella sp. JEL0078]